jgi:hypothetical protein
MSRLGGKNFHRGKSIHDSDCDSFHRKFTNAWDELKFLKTSNVILNIHLWRIYDLTFKPPIKYKEMVKK